MSFMAEVLGDYPRYIHPPLVEEVGENSSTLSSFKTLKEEFRVDVSEGIRL